MPFRDRLYSFLISYANILDSNSGFKLYYVLHYHLLVQLDVVLASHIQDDLTTVVIQQWMMTI